MERYYSTGQSPQRAVASEEEEEEEEEKEKEEEEEEETPSTYKFVTVILRRTGPRSKYTNRISTSQRRVSTSCAKGSQSVILTRTIAVYCDRFSACCSC
jgi:hypothetical protein